MDKGDCFDFDLYIVFDLFESKKNSILKILIIFSQSKNWLRRIVILQE